MSPATSAPCVHRWRIETPAGPKARGECRHCGAVRMFSNVEVDREPTFSLAYDDGGAKGAERKRKRR